MKCGRRGFSKTGDSVCTQESGHAGECEVAAAPIVSREQQLDAEVAQLKMRIAHLENGVGVIENADAYAAKQKAYAEQVERLAAGLTAAREEVVVERAEVTRLNLMILDLLKQRHSAEELAMPPK